MEESQAIIKNRSIIKYWYQFLLLVGGSTLMGLGASLAIKSSLGADTVALLWEGMNNTFSISLGTSNLIFSLVLLVLVYIVDKSYIGIGTIISPVIQSTTMDFLDVALIIPSSDFYKVIFMFAGIVILAVGCGVYGVSKCGCGSFMGAVFAISGKKKISITVVKLSFDSVCLILALLFGAYPSIGTIINLLTSGYIIDKTVEKITECNFYKIVDS